MKKTIYFIIFIGAALLSASCTKVQENWNAGDVKDSDSFMELRDGKVFMSISVGYQTRTTINDDLTIDWNKGDTLWVVAPTGGCLGYLVAEKDGSAVKFSGNLNSWAGIQDIQFYYLGSGHVSTGATTFAYDISSQNGNLHNIALTTHIMHGVQTDVAASNRTLGALSMTSLIAVAKFDLLSQSGFNASSDINLYTFSTATLDLTKGQFTNLLEGQIALKNPSSEYYTAIIPNTRLFKFSQEGAADAKFNASSYILANQFCTADGNAIVVKNTDLGGYTEEGWGYGPGIMINGITWAPVNCGVGYNHEYPDGKLYQFARYCGQPYVLGDDYKIIRGSLSANPDDNTFYAGTYNYWYSGTPYMDYWPIDGTYKAYLAKKIDNPCPEGWRIPTKEEFMTLLNKSTSSSETSIWIDETSTSFAGRKFYGNTSQEGNNIFLPAAGYRQSGNGTAKDRNTSAYYWTMTPTSSTYQAWALGFNKNGTPTIDLNYHRNGNSVRCVKESPLPHYEVNGIDYGAGIKIGDVIWAPVNCGYDDDHKYGLLYQWGRKYGSTYASSYTVGGVAYSAETYNMTYETGPISESEEQPTVFYWNASNWLNATIDTRWNNALSPNDASKQTSIVPRKNVYNDPCPNGWRVPTYYEFNILRGGKTNTLEDGKDMHEGLKGIYLNGSATASSTTAATVFLPAAGYQHTDKSFQHRGQHSDYWTSSVTGLAPWGFTPTDQGLMGRNRSFAFSVRCVYYGDTETTTTALDFTDRIGW